MFKKEIDVRVAKQDMVLVVEVLYDHGIEIYDNFEINGYNITLHCRGTNAQFNAAKKEMDKINSGKYRLHNGDAITL